MSCYIIVGDCRIEFSLSAGLPQATVTNLKKKTTKTSDILGIDPRHFANLIQMPKASISRFFHLDESTLSLAYTGLSGGGGCTSLPKNPEAMQPQPKCKPTSHPKDSESIISLAVSNQAEESAEDNDIHNLILPEIIKNKQKKNQKNAVDIAKHICKTIALGTIDELSIRKLAKVLPSTCYIPQAISEKLLDTIDANNLWAKIEDKHIRLAIAKIIRRFLMPEFLKTKGRAFFSRDSTDKYLKVLDQVNNRLAKNSDPELGMEIEVVMIIRLIARAVDTIGKPTKVVDILSVIIRGVAGLLKGNPGPLLESAVNYIERVKKYCKGKFIELIKEIGDLEIDIEAPTVNRKECLETFLTKKFEKISSSKWERIHILLNYTVDSIENKILDFSFLFNGAKFNTWMAHKDWRIREGCATCLRQLRGSEDTIIRKSATEMNLQMTQQENSRGYRNKRVEKVLKLGGIESIKFSNIRSKTPISDKYLNMKIERQNVVDEIYVAYSGRNFVMLNGRKGIGKTYTANDYFKQYGNLYSHTHKIDCETNKSFSKGMIKIVKSLKLQSNTKLSVANLLRSALHKCEFSMIIFLDGVRSDTPISDIYVRNLKVKYLATSRSQKVQKTLLIRPLSMENSMRILQKELSQNDTEGLDKLAEMAKGLPLRLVESAKQIKLQNCTTSKFIEKYMNDMIIQQSQEALNFVSSKLPQLTRSILTVISMCSTDYILTDVIKKVFLREEYNKGDWRASKKSLLDSDVISSEGDYWRIQNNIKMRIKKEILLESKDFKIIIDYYSEMLSINNSTRLNKKRIRIIGHELLSVNELLNSHDIEASKEILRFNLIYYYMKIKLIPLVAICYLTRFESHIISKNPENNDLAQDFKQLNDNYPSDSLLGECEEYYLKFLDILKKYLPKDCKDITDFNSFVVFQQYKKEMANKNEEEYKETLGNLPSSECSDRPLNKAFIYASLGNLKIENKDYQNSKIYYLQALELMDNNLKPNHPEFVSLYTNLGNLYRHKDKFEPSAQYYKKALDATSSILLEENADVAELYRHLSLAS